MSLAMKRRVTVLATTISILLVAGVVFAAFTANGDGAGTASSFAVTDSSDIDFDAPVEGLYPGHTETVSVTIVNNESFPVVVTDVADITATTTDADCDASLVTGELAEALSNATLDPTDSESYDMTVTMASTAVNACAGADFDFVLGASLASVPDAS